MPLKATTVLIFKFHKAVTQRIQSAVENLCESTHRISSEIYQRNRPKSICPSYDQASCFFDSQCSLMYKQWIVFSRLASTRVRQKLANRWIRIAQLWSRPTSRGRSASQESNSGHWRDRGTALAQLRRCSPLIAVGTALPTISNACCRGPGARYR